MQCIVPIKAGYDRAGNLTFKEKQLDPQMATFAFPCRKCLPCRLNYAREFAIRAYHESKMYEDNMFLTLTYNEESLTSDRLIYKDVQDFLKRLRETVTRDLTTKEELDEKKIPFACTGEYGEENKRPHWHLLLFNYRPSDEKKDRETPRGDQTYTSKILTDLWGKGKIEYGSLTMDSANYVARYAAKKLTHGNDQDHDFHPIHKRSKKYPIGLSWLKKYWKQTFNNGYVVIDGQKMGIPEYYTTWLKKNYPNHWKHYVTEVRPETLLLAAENERKEYEYWLNQNNPKQPKRKKVKEIILQSKFKKLQEKLKL